MQLGNKFDKNNSVQGFIQHYSSSLNLLLCHHCCIVLTRAELSFAKEASSVLNKSNINFMPWAHIHPPPIYTSAGYFVHFIRSLHYSLKSTNLSVKLGCIFCHNFFFFPKSAGKNQNLNANYVFLISINIYCQCSFFLLTFSTYFLKYWYAGYCE